MAYLPYGDFLWGLLSSRREEPEEELSGLIGTVGDGKQASIALTNVEGNLGDASTIDSKS